MRKRKQKNNFAIILTLCLLILIPVSAKAETPDFQKKGTLIVTMRDNGTKKPIPGGTVSIYQAAGIKQDDGSLSYEFTEAFRECGLSLENPQDYELAKRLKAYAAEKKLSAETKTVGKDGKTVFTELAHGLYLVVQTKAADGYYEINPFLIGIPQKNDEAWDYEVDAEPKTELSKPKPQKPKPEEPAQPKPPKPPAGTTPKTGDKNLPITAFILSGTLLLTAHWLRKKQS